MKDLDVLTLQYKTNFALYTLLMASSKPMILGLDSGINRSRAVW